MSRVLVRSTALLALLSALFLPGLAVTGSASAPANQSGPPDVSRSVAHATSPPLHSGAPLREDRGAAEKPLRLIPRGLITTQQDPVVQSSAGPAVATSGGLGFAGVGQGDYGFSDSAAPPDPNLAVGDTQVVQWVNGSFAVFNKSTGALVYGPAAGNTLWQALPSSNGCHANNDGDPIVQFDKAAHRWVMTQFSISSPSTYHYLQCVAVSTTNDATGAYNLYVFDYGTTAMPDYPKLGVWPDAYYVSYNIFNNGQTFAGAKVCAFDRNAMINGAGTATQQCVQLSSNYGGLLPADVDGSTPPPAGSPGLYLSFGSNSLNLWQFHVDWANTQNTTLTGPINIPVAAFTPACNGGGTCIPQPGTSQQLDSLGDRLMYRLAYRNYGDHEALVVDHSVTISGSQVVGLRWYELRNPAGSTFGQASASNLPVVYQQATFSPDSSYRWMGSIAMDHIGDIAMGYSLSSSSVYPSIYITGRTVSDAPNTMEAETLVKAGGGYQTYPIGGLSRWGDYTSMSVDPSDDCTFWYTDEYLKSSGGFNWSTWIDSFKFPSCTGTTTTAPAAPSTLAATAASISQINLSWTDNSTNESGFYIERSPDGATWSQIAQVGAGTTSYADSNLSASATYYYRVRAYNSAGTSSYSNTASATTQAISAPAAPSNLNATAVSSSEIDLTWIDNSSNETGFQIERSSDGGSTWSPLTTAGANVTSYADTGLPASTAYTYRVYAYNSGGNSGYSNTSSATTQSAAILPAAPSNLTASSLSHLRINLSWTDNANNETGFYVERSLNQSTWTQIASLSANTTSYQDSGLASSTKYYYRVRAYNSSGTSNYSNVASATSSKK